MADPAKPVSTTAVCSAAFFTCSRPAAAGAIARRNTGPPPPSTIATIDGRRAASGGGCSKKWRHRVRHPKNSASIAPPSGPTAVPPAEKGGQAAGRSRGGRTSKIHLSADHRGRPVAVTLTPRNIADITMARPLLDAGRAPKTPARRQSVRRTALPLRPGRQKNPVGDLLDSLANRSLSNRQKRLHAAQWRRAALRTAQKLAPYRNPI